MNQKIETQTKCDDIVENTQGLIDKNLLLDTDTSKKCMMCKKGFITEMHFESFDKTETSEKVFCSNALCWFNQTRTHVIGTSVIEVTPMVMDN